ncbi:MAG: hypothetical protein KKF44_07870 [Nanoarchaeota archaeon]|nr:hypothetical protein [Nanoarchaeota archaeon]
MFADICFPKGNEEKFIDIAVRLKTPALCFIYDAKTFGSAGKKNPEEPEKDKKRVKIFRGKFIASKKELQRMQKGPDLIVSDLIDREFVESKKINLHYGFENLVLKDSMHYRRSGLNQVLARILSDKEKLYAVSFSNIVSSKNLPTLFGRLHQNARLLKKYKCRVVAASFAREPYMMKAEKELLSVMSCLGFDSGLVRKSTEELFLALSEKI